MLQPYLKISNKTDFDDLPYRFNDIAIFNEIAKTSDDNFDYYPIHSTVPIAIILDIIETLPNASLYIITE